MKLIVEAGDDPFAGLPPGTYQLAVHQSKLDYEMETGATVVHVRTLYWFQGEVVRRLDEAVSGPLPSKVCDECGGSGQWVNPANGRRSPCSRGCRP